MQPTRLGTFFGAATVTLMACATSAHDDDGDRSVTAALRDKVQNIVVIYAENRSFDNIFGNFPEARGLDEVVRPDGTPRHSYIPQKDRDGSVLATLPQTWHGVTAAGFTPVVTQAASGGLPNAPFSIETAFTPASAVELSTATVTRDLYHRFFENQM
jgi:phospholipase C